MKIYYAAPLFNDMELNKNERMKRWLESKGYFVYLPQDEAGLAYEKIDDNNKMQINKKIFESDVKCIKKSDLLIFDLNGRVPDEGGCVELGMAYAWGIKCIGFKTDTRALDYTGDDNLMIEGCMNFKIARNLEELEKMLKEIAMEIN